MAGNLYYPLDVGANGYALLITIVWDFTKRLEWTATRDMLTDKGIVHWANEDFSKNRLIITAEVFTQKDINELLNVTYEALNVR